MKKIMFLLIISVILFTGCSPETPETSDTSSMIDDMLIDASSDTISDEASENKYIIEDLLFEKNLLEIKKQCNVIGEETYPFYTLIAVEDSFDSIEGTYFYTIKNDQITEVTFFARVSYYSSIKSEDIEWANTSGLERDNIDATEKMAKDIFELCNERYGFYVVSSSYRVPSGEYYSGGSFDNFDDMKEFIRKVIDDEIADLAFRGFNASGTKCLSLKFFNTYAGLIITIEATDAVNE